MKAPLIHALALSAALFVPAVRTGLAASGVRLDADFHPDVNGKVAAIVVAADGSALIGGDFSAVNGAARARLARVNADGSVDGQFNAGADAPVSALALLPGGMIAVGGRFANVNQVDSPNLAILSSNGRVLSAEGTLGGVSCLTVNVAGELLLGGGLRAVQGQSRCYVALLDGAGGLNESFVPALQTSWAMESGVSALAFQENGKVIAGGVFNTAAGAASLVRLNADGSLDAGFAGDCGSVLYVGAIHALADGRILVGGMDRNGKGFVRRLNAERSVDLSFAAPELDGMVKALAVDGRGRVVAGGVFSTASGGVLRLRHDGSVDPEWHARIEGAVSALAIDGEKRVLVGGYLRVGEVNTGLVRVIDSGSVTQMAANAGAFRGVLRAQAGLTYSIESSTDLLNWAEVSTSVATEEGLEVFDDSASGRRHRFFRARLVQ